MTAPVLNTAGDSTPGRLQCVDINLATNPNGSINTISPNFQPFQYVNSVDFNPDDPTMVDATVYGDGGFTGSDKLGAGWTLTLILNHMIVPGTAAYDQTHNFLENRAVGQFGPANRVQLRMYDYDVNDPTGVLTPRGQAYMGFANYSWPRFGAVGQADARMVSVPFIGKGRLNLIAHPYPAVALAPTITSLNPTTFAASGSQGKQVIITGTGFTSTIAGGVKFGGSAAVSFIVESDSRIVASVPTLTAGSVTVTVQNAVGTSAAATFTAT